MGASGIAINLSNANTWAATQTFSQAIVAPTSTNTINGLVINSGALSNVASITGSGNLTVQADATNGSLTLHSAGTGDVYVDSGTTGSVNVATDSAHAKILTLGNTAAGSGIHVRAPTGGITLVGLDAAANGPKVICIESTTNILHAGASTTDCKPSSARYKHNILDLSEGIDVVNKLRHVSYAYNNNNEESIGFIAEEVAKIDPRLVVFNAQGQPDALEYDQFIPILAKGLQEVDAKVTSSQNASDAKISSAVLSAMDAVFHKSVEFFAGAVFRSSVEFISTPTFNNDAAGFAVLSQNTSEAAVTYQSPFASAPVVVATPNTPIPFAVTNESVNGFTIRVQDPVKESVRFSWTATQVKNVKTFTSSASEVAVSSPSPSPTQTPSSTPEPATSATPSPTPSPTPSDQSVQDPATSTSSASTQ